jgi:hypothetical protein
LFHPFQAHLCLLGWNMASWSHGSGRLKYMLLCRQANFWSIHFPLFTVPFWLFVNDSITHFRDFTFLFAWKWSHLLTAYLALYSFLSSIILILIFRMTKDWQKIIWVPSDINSLQWP